VECRGSATAVPVERGAAGVWSLASLTTTGEEQEMHTIARHVRRAGAVLLVAGAVGLGIAAPAAAAPQPRGEERCTGPFDGVSVCYRLDRGQTPDQTTVTAIVRAGLFEWVICCYRRDGGQTPDQTTVTAIVRAEAGRTLQGALVAIEACDPACKPVGVETGRNATAVDVTRPYGRGVGFYRANAS